MKSYAIGERADRLFSGPELVVPEFLKSKTFTCYKVQSEIQLRSLKGVARGPDFGFG